VQQRRSFLTGLLGSGVLLAAGCSGEEPQPAPPPVESSTPTPAPTPTPTPSPKPKPKPAEVDALSGGKPSKNAVFAAKIDNLAAARPQFGISKADVIVVEEVEARLTRLVGIFHTTFPTAVGPVRSARNTDVEFLPLFGKPGLVYSGANSKVQANVRGSSHLVPIERNDRLRSRPAPHNVVVNLAAIAKQRKVGALPDSIGWTFADDDDALWKKAATRGKFTEKIGSDTFTFTPKGSQYQVAVGSDVYDDATTNKAVRADTVVVLSVKNRKDRDTTSSLSIVSETIGKGKVTVTRNGRTRSGTWERKKITDKMTFTDGDGKPITLRPGQTWLLLQGS